MEILDCLGSAWLKLMLVLFGVLFVETFGSVILVVDSKAKTETETTTKGYFTTEIKLTW